MLSPASKELDQVEKTMERQLSHVEIGTLGQKNAFEFLNLLRDVSIGGENDDRQLRELWFVILP